MKTTLAFIHAGGNLPLELLALTGALFLFLYIKKENFNIWFSFASVVIIALVLLSMACSIIGGMAHHRRAKHHEEEGYRHRMFRHEMGMRRMSMGWMGREGMESRGLRMNEEERGERGWEKQRRTPEERAEAVSERIGKDLGVNDDQKKKIYAVALVRAQKMQEVMEKGDNDRADLKAALKPANDAFEAGLKTILTPEQFAKWKADKESRMKNRHGDEKE
jgi:protein CpxP